MENELDTLPSEEERFEEFERCMDEYYEYLYKEREKFEKALDYYKENCIIPFEDTEDIEILNFEDDEFFHIGYCKVEKTDYKNHWYKNAEYFRVIGFEGDSNSKDSFKFLHFMKVNEGDNFHTLVWQQTGPCEDDYSGYILYPMKDGRYWVVSFSM